MRFFQFQIGRAEGLAVHLNGRLVGLLAGEPGYPGDLDELIRRGRSALTSAAKTLTAGRRIDRGSVVLLPPLRHPEKVICVGLNYREHSAESGFKQPDYPTLFGRFNSSLIGDGAPIVRPRASIQLDFEGELVAIIGKPGRDIAQSDALDHVVGYSIFNDASIRDFSLSRRSGPSEKTSTVPAHLAPASSPPMSCRPAEKGFDCKRGSMEKSSRMLRQTIWSSAWRG